MEAETGFTLYVVVERKATVSGLVKTSAMLS